jgi:hypothetical protein
MITGYVWIIYNNDDEEMVEIAFTSKVSAEAYAYELWADDFDLTFFSIPVQD